MQDELKHECAVAMVVLRKTAVAAGDFGGTKLSLLLEKQHNRGQDGAGAAILSADPRPGEEPYWIAKSASATPLVDVLGAIGKRPAAQEQPDRSFSRPLSKECRLFPETQEASRGSPAGRSFCTVMLFPALLRR